MTDLNGSFLSSLYGGSSASTPSGLDSSLLLNYFNAKLGTSAASGNNGSGPATLGPNTSPSPTGSSDAPSAPWSGGSGMLQEDALVTKVMQGRKFIDPNAVTSNVSGASPDYTKLFTLYQGLNALEGIATAAQAKNVSANQMSEYQRRFAAGLSEVDAYVGATKFDHVDLTEGTLTKELKNTVGAAKTNSGYNGRTIATGSASTSVKAFEGDVKFSMSVKKIGTATPFAIDFDLSEMGTETRSMSNVVSYINAKLKDAGLSTKMVVNRTPAVPVTTTVNGKTTTLSAGQDTLGLQIKGTSSEIVTFSAPATADSVYVVQTTGDPTKKLTAPKDPTKAPANGTDVTSQVMKFQTDQSSTATQPSDAIGKPGSTYWTGGEAEQIALPDSIANVATSKSGTKSLSGVLASAAGPDGSLYVLGNVNAKTDGQELKGSQDVALMKYDSAGNMVYTRTLGAADTASGFALAVSADGKVAIAGSVTGALDVATSTVAKDGTVTTTTAGNLDGSSPSTADSFVTVFDASGVEQWTQRRGGSAADEATSVAFGADGSVYVGGRTQSTMPGATGSAQGGWDGYVSSFSSTGKVQFTQQSGTSQTDATSKVVIDQSTMYVASLENNATVLRSYDLTSGKPVLKASRDIGGLGGGNISGMSVYNGKIYLGGSAGSDKLLAGTGTVTSAYSGSYDAFALSVDADLTTTADDKIAFYGGTGAEKNAQVQFSNGKAWISGQTSGAIAGTTQTGKGDAYLARVNIDSGAVEYQTRYSGTDSLVTPNSIAISSGSSSVLDKLGLPMGTILQADSNTVVANSSTRAGDQFYMVDPSTGTKKTITIDAGETMDSLAKKIVRASGHKLKVTVTKVLGKQESQLDIKPANDSSSMEFVAGPAGKDALAGLGLNSGLVTSKAGVTVDSSSSNYTKTQKPLGLNFDVSLNLNSTQNIADAIKSLQTTIKSVQRIYTYLKYGDPQPQKAKTGSNSGAPPAYLTNEIANYQAALQRLTGGS